MCFHGRDTVARCLDPACPTGKRYLPFPNGRPGPLIASPHTHYPGPDQCNCQQLHSLNGSGTLYLASLDSANNRMEQPLGIHNRDDQNQIVGQGRDAEEDQEDQEDQGQEDEVDQEQENSEEGDSSEQDPEQEHLEDPEDNSPTRGQAAEAYEDKIETPTRRKDTNQSGNRHQRVLKHLDDQAATLSNPVKGKESLLKDEARVINLGVRAG